MVTIFVAICFIIAIVAIVRANTAHKKESGYYKSHPELNCSYTFHCKKLNKAESVLNLGADAKGLAMFAYHNRQVFIKMNDGKTLSGMLENMTATFDCYKGNVNCKLSCNGQKVEIYSVWHLFTDDEWWTIYNILTHCGTTYNEKDYIDTQKLYGTKEGKTTRGLITAARIISGL